MSNFVKVLMIFGFFILTGCASTKLELFKFKSIEIPIAEIRPTKEVMYQGENKKNVIVITNDTFKGMLSSALIGAPVNVNEDLITTDKITKKHIDLYTRGSPCNMRCNEEIDYLLVPHLDPRISVSRTYTPYRKKICTTGNKKYDCSLKEETIYSVAISTTLDMYRMNDLFTEVENSYSFKGRSTELFKGNVKLQSNSIDKLTTKAINDSIFDNIDEIKNIFKPTGYVLEGSVNDNKYAFKVSGGLNIGMLTGQKVKIFSATSKELISSNKNIEYVEICDGIVSDQVYSSYVWIIAKCGKDAKKISIGNKVESSFKTSFLNNIGSHFKNAFMKGLSGTIDSIK